MRWQSDVIGLHVVSDIAIAVAYFLISLAMVRFLRKRRDIRFSWLFAAFALFILACGSTHVMDVITLWSPLYRLAGILKALTAIVSVGTAAALLRIWPALLRLPTTRQLEQANQALETEAAEHRSTRIALEKANAELLTQLDQKLEEFKITFESAAIGLAHVAPDGRFLRVNEYLCDLIGYSRQELGSLTFAAITHPEDLAADWALAKSVLTGQRQSYSMRKRYRHKEGRIVWVALHVSLVRDTSGEPDYFIAAIRDVTEQKQAEKALQDTVARLAERERQLEIVFERAELGDWRWDILRDETFAHPIVFRQYGCSETTGPVPSSWFSERQHPDDYPSVSASLARALESKSHFDLEFRVIHPDQSIRWLACRGSIVRDANGTPIATHGISLDITVRKEAEAAVTESATQLATLTDVLPQLLWFAKPNGDVEFFNRQWYEYTGQTANRALDWGWQPVIHPDDLDRCLQTWGHALSTGAVYDIEYRLRRTDGAYRWHLGRAIPVRDATGQIIRWFGSCTDIHDLKSAETNLRSFQEELEKQVADRTAALLSATELNRRIFENSPDCIQVLETHGYLISSNPAGCRALDMEPLENQASRYWPDIWHGEGRVLAAAAIDMARHGEQGAFRSLRLNTEGIPQWWDVRITAIPDAQGEPERLLAVWRDITAQKIAEQAASDAKHRLDIALQGARIGAWTWDPGADKLSWHGHCATLFGFPDAPLISDLEHFTSLVHPQDRTLVESKLTQAFESGCFEAEYRIIWPDGSLHVIRSWAEVLFQNKKPVQMAGICWDITVRKQAEQLLQNSESRLREAQQIAQLGDWDFDLLNQQIHWSEEIFRIFGVPTAEGITYERYQALLPPEDRARVLAAVEHTISTGEPYELTHRVLRPDGSHRYIDARGRLDIRPLDNRRNCWVRRSM